MKVRLHYLYRAYRYRLLVDRAELRYMCGRLRPGDVAVDIGAHKGAYTYWMRRCVGPAGAVFAFEPQPKQVEYLQAAFAAMRYANVTLVPMGVSSAPGQLPLCIPAGAGETHLATFEQRAESREQRAGKSFCGYHPAPATLSVPVTTLDAFFSDQPRGPDFLKIDVEGHESAVLAGARRTLEAHRPAILIECEARHRADGDVRPVFESLKSLGYVGSFFLRGRRRPLAEFDSAVHQRIDSNTAGLPRGYVNNFAFEFNW